MNILKKKKKSVQARPEQFTYNNSRNLVTSMWITCSNQK